MTRCINCLSTDVVQDQVEVRARQAVNKPRRKTSAQLIISWQKMLRYYSERLTLVTQFTDLPLIMPVKCSQNMHLLAKSPLTAFNPYLFPLHLQSNLSFQTCDAIACTCTICRARADRLSSEQNTFNGLIRAVTSHAG